MSGVPDKKSMDGALAHLAPIVSHEIRNPLAIIGNSSYFIKTKLSKDGETDPKIARHLQIIEAELKHANDVLSEILAYSRMPANPKKKSGIFKALVDAAVNALAKPPGVAVKVSGDGGQPEMDSTMMALAVTHLLRNAVEACGEKGTVTVTLSCAGDYAGLSIVDTGPGLPEDALPRLFEPFNTTKPRGVGLGLAYVREAVRRHGGSVVHDGGSAFKITLPL